MAKADTGIDASEMILRTTLIASLDLRLEGSEDSKE
jgi:hypothetical protein